jgi:hypothetical protein
MSLLALRRAFVVVVVVVIDRWHPAKKNELYVHVLGYTHGLHSLKYMVNFIECVKSVLRMIYFIILTEL